MRASYNWGITLHTDGFSQKCFTCSQDLFQELEQPEYGNKWAFRGQLCKWPLETSFSRSCIKSNYVGQCRANIEEEMIRHFKRVYVGPDINMVNKDTLYCLSLMQHHGAPTRLLDFTYSAYVAIYFALQYAYDNKKEDKNPICSVWCINTDWVTSAAKNSEQAHNLHSLFIDKRSKDKTRNEKTFRSLYLSNEYELVSWENPLTIHQRLHLHQGVFLCPGDIRKPFQDNLKNLSGWNQKSHLLKINCEMETDDLRAALEKCHRMNLSRESLFPGLEGFSQAMKYNLLFYSTLWHNRHPSTSSS